VPSLTTGLFGEAPYGGVALPDRMPAGSAMAVLRLDGAREFSESCGKPVSRIDC
jgi:hypothetical protein